MIMKRVKMRVKERFEVNIRRMHMRFLQKVRKMISHKLNIKLTMRGSWTKY